MKIIKVEKRNSIASFFSEGHKEWKVTMQDDDGEIRTFNAWPGMHDPTIERLLGDIDDKYGIDFTDDSLRRKYAKGEYIEGIEKAALAVEGRAVTQVNNKNIVIQVDTNTQSVAAQTTHNHNIAATMRQQAANVARIGLGIRRGK